MNIHDFSTTPSEAPLNVNSIDKETANSKELQRRIVSSYLDQFSLSEILDYLEHTYGTFKEVNEEMV